MPTATIFLPWPNRKLSPNARVHWSALARAKKAAKNTAYYTALEAGLRKIDADRVTVRYTFSPPTRHAYDLDNLVARMKAAADGIAMAIGVDDRNWHLEIAPVAEVTSGGQVKIEIIWNARETAA